MILSGRLINTVSKKLHKLRCFRRVPKTELPSTKIRPVIRSEHDKSPHVLDDIRFLTESGYNLGAPASVELSISCGDRLIPINKDFPIRSKVQGFFTKLNKVVKFKTSEDCKQFINLLSHTVIYDDSSKLFFRLQPCTVNTRHTFGFYDIARFLSNQPYSKALSDIQTLHPNLSDQSKLLHDMSLVAETNSDVHEFIDRLKDDLGLPKVPIFLSDYTSGLHVCRLKAYQLNGSENWGIDSLTRFVRKGFSSDTSVDCDKLICVSTDDFPTEITKKTNRDLQLEYNRLTHHKGT